MTGLSVDEALERLAALHPQIRAMMLERRRQQPDGAPTRLQEFALLMIRERGGMLVSDVAALLEVSAPTASQLLSAMEEKGWLQRGFLPEDRRRHRVTLTDAGLELVAQMEASRRAVLARMLAELTAEERARLVALTERLVEVLPRVSAASGIF